VGAGGGAGAGVDSEGGAPPAFTGAGGAVGGTEEVGADDDEEWVEDDGVGVAGAGVDSGSSPSSQSGSSDSVGKATEELITVELTGATVLLTWLAGLH